MIRLTTKRLEIRQFDLKDKEELYQIIQDEKIAKYLPGVYTNSELDVDRELNLYIKGDMVNDIYLAVVEKSTGKLVGAIILVRTYRSNMELSYFVCEEKRGQGIILEAMKEFLKWYLENDFKNTIIVDVMKSNVSSMRLCKKMIDLRIPLLLMFENEVRKIYIIRPWDYSIK